MNIYKSKYAVEAVLFTETSTNLKLLFDYSPTAKFDFEKLLRFSTIGLKTNHLKQHSY